MIIGLAFSGLTAFPLEAETGWLVQHRDSLPDELQNWLQQIHEAIATTNRSYPYLSYGTDWLAFAHLMLAVLFIGPLQNPVKNKWVIEFGMIACMLIIPLAFIAGSIREIPVFWRLIDCSFGIIGIIPLVISYKNINRLENLQSKTI